MRIGQITAEMIQAEGNTKRCKVYRFINSISSKEEFPHQWKESIIMHIYKVCDKTDCSHYKGYHCYQLRTKLYPLFFSVC
jgi:hypothetical protein